MLAGNPPHVGSSAQQIIMKIIAEPAAPVTQWRKAVPPNVAAALDKGLEKLPADRFATAKEFADALANPGYTTTSFATTAVAGARRGVPVPIFAATATIGALAIVAAIWRGPREEPPASPLRVAVAMPEAQALERSGTMSRAVISPDGRTLVYVGTGENRISRLWMRHLDQLQATPIARTEAGGNPAFSPDGAQLAFVSETPRALKTMPLAGGPVEVLADSAVDLGGVTWSSDGYIYYDGKLTGDGLARVRATGGTPEIATVPNTETGERWHARPSALPDGRGVLFTAARVSGQSNFTIAVLDSRTGKHSTLVPGLVARYAASGHLLYITDEGALMAAPFDLDRLAITGDAVVIAEGLSTSGPAARGATLAVSDRGRLVYVAGESTAGARELVWVSRNGNATPVDTSWRANLVGRPVLSPDGRRAAIAVSERRVTLQVWLKDLDHGPTAKLEGAGAAPAWSPDGQTVIFSSSKGLMRGPSDVSALPALYRPETGQLNTSSVEWSRDGKWLLYARQNQDLFAVNTESDTGTHEILATPAVERQPALSPDSRWFAYASDETGRYEVYVRPFPDAKVAKRQVSLNGGFAPRWSKDGGELFYADETQTLFVVPTPRGAVFAPGIPQRLFDAFEYSVVGVGFDVHPDGKRFLMTRPAGAAARQRDEVILVENVFDELRTKVPRK